MPDHPVVTIELRGLSGAGKSVLAAQIRRLLDELLIAWHGPELLPQRSPGELAVAVANLKKRGLRVELIETQTGRPPQIDARWPRQSLRERPRMDCQGERPEAAA